MRASSLMAVAASLLATSATAAYKGFNYGSTFTDGSYKAQSDFEGEFNSAKNLVGPINPFTSARLYTMIQGGTTDTPTSAIPAAISTQTTLLLGLWASAGQATITSEINALKAAISQYGTAFTSLIAGISVGSEDLYRITPTGIANNAGVGAAPSDITSYISQVRSAIAGTSASSALVGHVDTWTAWVNGSNSAVVSACDFIGMDAYPYFETTLPNSIGNANATFWDAYDNTVGAAQGKPVWM
jgi:glucan endo-1,3-beta-D-glucosidase